MYAREFDLCLFSTERIPSIRRNETCRHWVISKTKSILSSVHEHFSQDAVRRWSRSSGVVASVTPMHLQNNGLFMTNDELGVDDDWNADFCEIFAKRNVFRCDVHETPDLL